MLAQDFIRIFGVRAPSGISPIPVSVLASSQWGIGRPSLSLRGSGSWLTSSPMTATNFPSEAYAYELEAASTLDRPSATTTYHQGNNKPAPPCLLDQLDPLSPPAP